MRLYAFLGQSIAQRDVAGDNPYREWIETHATPDFEKLAAGLEEILNRYVTRAEEEAARSAYRRAMSLELAFFEVASSVGRRMEVGR